MKGQLICYNSKISCHVHKKKHQIIYLSACGEALSISQFFAGICSKCGQKVSGEGNGCTAMDKLFHIKCFVCDKCGEYLSQLPQSSH